MVKGMTLWNEGGSFRALGIKGLLVFSLIELGFHATRFVSSFSWEGCVKNTGVCVSSKIDNVISAEAEAFCLHVCAIEFS